MIPKNSTAYTNLVKENSDLKSTNADLQSSLDTANTKVKHRQKCINDALAILNRDNSASTRADRINDCRDKLNEYAN